MRVCLIQLDVSLKESLDERVAQACEKIRRCSGAELVVLPELWAHGAWNFAEWAQIAEPLDGPTVTALAQAAKDAQVMLHGGSIVERSGDELYNTAVLLGIDGDLRASYRKIHTFGWGEGEGALITAGNEFLTLSGLGLQMGIATCYDLRFPELFRKLTDAGAELFVIASSWPAKRAEHWRLLTKARAVENLAYVIGTNACGAQAGVRQAGYSVVIDPWGKVVAEAGTDAAILDLSIDPLKGAQLRAEFPALDDRRID